MENQILTIDPGRTKAKLKADGRTVAAYARLRGIPETSMAHILAGRFPFNDKPEGIYQKAARALAKDGYLVEMPSEPQAA